MLRCVCGKAFVTTVGYETHVATQECHTKAEPDRIDAGQTGLAYIVWNQDKSEGFATNDKQLAYEVRKGSDGNCYDENGKRHSTAIEFIEEWGADDCTIEVIGAGQKGGE